MASSNGPMANGPHNGQLDIDQDRRRWFADFEAIKARFEAEKETIRSRFLQQQRDACTDLDDEARYADLPGLPQKARDLIQKYQGELRSHRWAACQHRFEDEEKDRTRREKDALREHHMVFPVPGFSGHNVRNAGYGSGGAGPSSRPSTTVSSQAPTTGRVGLPSDILARGSPSSSMTNAIPQARQPLPQGAGVSPHTTQPNQSGLSRPVNAAAGERSSAPMPQHQLHNQGRQPQQHMNQNQHNQNWPHQGQSAPQQGSPHVASIYQHQNRPANGSPGANGPHRVLPSQVQVPMLGSNHYGPMRTKPAVARTSSSGHSEPTDSLHSNRVPLPPINAPQIGSRDDRFQAHNAGNMSQLPTPRPEDMARQAMDIQRLAKRKSDASETSVRDTESKRARVDSPQSIAPRTITFKEVYQDGKAEYKHNIVKYDDVFYILRCDEHGVHFKQNALAAAAKHLHGASHGHQKKEHKLAVETIGFHVVDCTEELAALNNECVRQAFENGYKPLNQLHGPKSGGKRHSGGAAALVDAVVEQVPSVPQSPFHTAAQVVELQDVTEQDETEQEPQQEPQHEPQQEPQHEPQQEPQQEPQHELQHELQQEPQQEAKQQTKQETKQQDSTPTKYILNPKAGELYHAKWPRSSKLYTVMVLGWTDLKMCGWEEKLSETQLCDKKIRPACYVYNHDGIAGWAPGYGDGEARVLERDVPVLWFESKGKTRLGWLGIKWLLKPMVLDDPNRPADPDHPSNQARKRYADIRGYDSFEAMLASSGTEGALPTKVPSSASASDSDSTPDVDMYDFGDNPPPVDDSDDEDYVERASRKGKESDDEMVDAEERLATPQPLRRSTQEVRPTSRLAESGWPSGRLGAAAGTRLSARKERSTADREDVTMEDARPATPSKSRATSDERPSTMRINGALPNVALGTPATPTTKDAAKTAQTNRSTSVGMASPDSMPGPAERVGLWELSRGNPSQRFRTQEDTKTNNTKASRHGENESRLDHAAMTNLAQSAMKAASKSPSLSKEATQISPVLQVADLLNGTTSSEKATKQSSLAFQAKPSESRRPLPSGPMQDSRSPGATIIHAAARRRPLPHKPVLGPISGQKEDVSQQPSPALSLQSNKEEMPTLVGSGTQAPRCASAGSAESVPRRSDPRMSISNAVDDHDGDAIKRAELSLSERDQGNNNGISSGNSTPRVLTHISLANDARWRAVRTSESPRMSPAMIQSPSIDRSAAASPALGGKKELDMSIDVAEFHEGDKHWAREGEFLRFVLEDESSGVVRTRKEDGIEATVDPGQVKAAQMTGLEVRLMLKTGGEQRFVFSANALTGSHRGAKLQTTKFYRWVTAKNADIEHIG
ncbi:hypothetical protein CI238_04394 [Colletotrichum incanum]|uniref:Uncharacterized protein n=1 Tax=Colletotrichum incanum TaxID=1573173 RepID=A0A166VBF2_COLIC|nr:hypothetical protein CI238_04394 [Colletotrichum incanum]